ncbi:hypothetical protein GPK34_08910 [Secundilactobacillus kimchicus]|uniref:Uncharacterized protein n=2 Tax=Secundilactobacillus kimchicus TaxID=528209 RepID=A0A0R1HP67_9LACO|nr:hypothetical protein [Secundilactobacillus kimchicus]KRK48629.1 hypothetical protein FC96_GL000942 [Secundilactobacillus kimchicus JCM 15530]MBT9672149.1 hypothetical protein [Secundilactobacillus kimchicus]
MPKVIESTPTQRQLKFTLWLLIHTPRHVAFTDLETFFGEPADVLHHDLNWMATFLHSFDLVVDPSVDQRVAIYGREANVFRAIQELLGHLKTSDRQTRYVLDAPTMETKLAAQVDQLSELETVNIDTWQAVYNYLWTLNMRYQYGRVKRASLDRLFTPDQLALISTESAIHHWSQQCIDVVESELKVPTSLPIIESYLLTLRVWLLTH